MASVIPKRDLYEALKVGATSEQVAQLEGLLAALPEVEVLAKPVSDAPKKKAAVGTKKT